MTTEYMHSIEQYKSAMAQARVMLARNLITPAEYTIIETKMSERFGINSCSLFRENEWINTPIRGNIAPDKEVV